MTQEEKFKKAKRLYETANADQKYVLEKLFPELKESEDERIIDNLISQLCNLYTRKLIKEETKDKYVNWLKSLKERIKE